MQVGLPLAGDTHRAVADDDLAIALGEVVEAGDALGLGPLGATGAGRRVGDAALLGAVGEHRLERRAIEAVDGQLGEAEVDGALMADVHDRTDGRCRPPKTSGARRPSASIPRLTVEFTCGAFAILLRRNTADMVG